MTHANPVVFLTMAISQTEGGVEHRLERALDELGGYRMAVGRSTTPDFNEEDRLRADLHNSEAQKRQLGQDSQALANLVLNLAHKQALSQHVANTPGKAAATSPARHQRTALLPKTSGGCAASNCDLIL